MSSADSSCRNGIEATILSIAPQSTIFGKAATATYIVTAVIAMLFNYLGHRSVLVDAAIWASLAITLISGFHYMWHAARIIEEPQKKGRTRVA